MSHKNVGIVALGVAAACAISALTAGGASALPEVGRCVSSSGSGRYRDSNCTHHAGKPASEKNFEWEKGAGGAGRAFTAAGEGEAELESSGLLLSCGLRSPQTTATGEYREASGAIKEVTNVVLRLRGCEVPLLDQPCVTKGASGEEIVTSALRGKLGYISGKGTQAPVVGLELTPMAGKKGLVAVCEVFGATFEIGQGAGAGGDRIIATVANANAMSATFGLTFAKKEVGVQSPGSFEGLFKIANLEWRASAEKPFERMTWSLQTTISSEQALEIKA